MMVKRALLSVSDKAGIVEFARELSGMGTELISTGGTKKKLQEAGIKVKDISEFTGFPEMMDGRVKTLHPKVHGGILNIRENPQHQEAMRKNAIQPIDMVVVNLYPFEEAVRKNPDDLENAIENIDIGGPAMIRSAAKNYKDVIVITDPSDYGRVISELKEKGGVPLKMREALALKVFRRTADYDSGIDTYLSRKFLGEEVLRLSMVGGTKLRYGENPHQEAAWYKDPKSDFSMSCLQGKELSFNNLMDINAAVTIAGEFQEPCCIIIKHNNPCGAAIGKEPLDAFLKAKTTDPLSAFGGIVSFNREVDAGTAEEIDKMFVEVVVAPQFSDGAKAEFSKKKNLRLIEINKFPDREKEKDYKKIAGGLLVQDADTKLPSREDLKVVTKAKPTDEQLQAMLFGWKVTKHVKSNAILFV
ncbi:MAG: bifunctional phosphoribosylaminoimidazolecarboxamide formyltransferase/IMP cyclohydrolase, partial [Candidatus Aenigmatarchaeota archaeon]